MINIQQLKEDINHDSEGSEDEKDKKSKRARASWTQRIALENVFQTNQYPSPTKRQELAQKLGMSQRKVQVWFQNRRIKAKTVADEDTHQLQLLSQAVDGKEVNLQQEGTGNSLLLIAIAMDHPAIHSLLSKGADCNLANLKGWTPLYTSIVYNHKHLVEILLNKKYNVNVNAQERVYGQSALHYACLKGLESIVWILLSKSNGLSINIQDFEGRTPLHHSCINSFTEITRQLLDSKADPRVPTRDGITPLHCACLAGNTETIRMLLNSRASVNCVDAFQYTPLHFATRENHLEAVEVLLIHGANANCLTFDGITPLHFACLRNNLRLVTLLVRYNAQVHIPSYFGKSPMDLAVLHGQDSSIIDFLRQSVQFFGNFQFEIMYSC